MSTIRKQYKCFVAHSPEVEDAGVELRDWQMYILESLEFHKRTKPT